jgi:pSer/pThr/pTyr-binding forkhead associated (FHA) protein
VRDHSRYGSFVNGERVERETELGAGDRLRVGTPGVVLELVTVG